ncbi:Zinc carboxypeptidase [Fontimonas thermophila]|uniref:Zinc carboxypeptidase n=1 Tax=Fontimonas thermophila TaxID=1076937 RepID=A0A1I2H5B2_9GAMM|nr:M14 family murein peptide amidase A [Fontimonas thermophila]SFF24573.1 Zinc carboxypeptidase [Fontimonas thermophila]
MPVVDRGAGSARARHLAGLFVLASGLVAGIAAAAAPALPLTTVERACALIGSRLQSVGVERCLAAGLQAAEGASVHGMPLLYRDYPPTSRRAPPQRVLLIGGIHGDELSSVSIVFQWMQHLAEARYQPFHWRVLPCANPDGLLRDPPTRTNARGVDLNRNFPTRDWQAEAMAYWEKRTGRDPRRYPGPAALSEPETRWLVQELETFRPDAIVSVHAPYGVLDFDGPREPPQRFGYLHLHQLGTYPGSLGNFAGINIGLPVITLELPHAGIMPSLPQQQRIWADMLTWLEKNLPAEAPLYFRLGDHPWNGQTGASP